jgi:4-hydroxybenzoate polyprenyltransferase
VYWELARPFTLLVPAVGFVTGAVCASGRLPHGWWCADPAYLRWGIPVALGTLMAASLNIASNALNQICDREIDSRNKPERPLPSGRIGLAHAWAFTGFWYVVSLLLAWMVVRPECCEIWDPRWAVWNAPLAFRECFWIVVAGALCTWVYSAPPFRTKRHWLLANLTIGIPRGMLLKVAGWSAGGALVAWTYPNIWPDADPSFLGTGWSLDPEPWLLGGVFFLFLVGAASTKDFADIEGDVAGGCVTMPARFGVRRAAWIVAPFLCLPWLLLPLGVTLGWFRADPAAMAVTGFGLAAYGAYTAWLILRDPEALALEANHPSWKHMYLLMLLAHLGTAAAYWMR